MTMIREKAEHLYSEIDRIEDNKLLTDIDKQVLKEDLRDLYKMMEDKAKADLLVKSWQNLKTIKPDFSGDMDEKNLFEIKCFVKEATGVDFVFKGDYAQKLKERFMRNWQESNKK